MPVNKHIGKLWFDTQEEEDEYDDLMVSNIELRSPSYDDPHFTIMSMRERRERVPQPTPKLMEQFQEYERYIKENKYRPPENYLTAYWTLPLVKLNFSFLSAYLLLRELPLRNFYARAFIMVIFGNYVRKYFRPDFFHNELRSMTTVRAHSDFT